MAETQGGASLFRARSPGSHRAVTFVELFFDLVFVFAVTQLSHELRAHFSPLGLLETAMLMLAVWWVWIFTAWITNWLDPDRTPVRLMLLVLMLFGLVLSSSIPEAFEHRGLIFALAFVGMQVGRTIFMLAAIPPTDVSLKRNFRRVLVWLAVSAVAWIVGGFAADELRLALWGLALVIEYLGPALRFWTPGLGRSSVDDWNVDGPHLAERAGLFIIIALGKSVLVIGDTFAETHWTAARLAAFVAAFVASVAMWWLYFDKGAELGVEQIRRAPNPGRLGRNAYTYLHLPIVAGIVLFAAGNELALAQPGERADFQTTVGILAGSMLYLVGVGLFKHSVRRRRLVSNMVGLGSLLALWLIARYLPALGLAAAGALVLATVAVWETRTLRNEAMAANE
ncbi:MAG TPA: low temperature requirement protein A [Polyangia bacterium]|nr:low temperature requirement protein A [Polyangia bacterium]